MQLGQMQSMQVQVPQGVMPGQMFTVNTPQGPMQVTAPPDAYPGQVFMTSVPGMGDPMMQQPMMQQPMMGDPMMQQPLMQQPDQMMYPPMMQQPMMPMMDGFSVLNQMQHCEVQEKVLWGEVLTAIIGVEVSFGNKYKVFDESGNEVFLFAEQTDFCTRQLKRGCCADCIGWNVDVINLQGGQRTNFLHMQRDNTLTFCCFNRPVVDIIDVSTQSKIGAIQDPWACCDLTFKLRGADDADVLEARGGCCQWGMWCHLPCGPCAEVSFDIVDIGSGSQVGKITKKVPSCLKFIIDDQVSNYQVDFNGVTNPQWKAIVLALSVFMDFRYFSENQDPEDMGQTGIIGMFND